MAAFSHLILPLCLKLRQEVGRTTTHSAWEEVHTANDNISKPRDSSPWAESKSITPAPVAHKPKVWAYFSFRKKEGTKDVNKSHAICKMYNAKNLIPGDHNESETTLSKILFCCTAHGTAVG